MQRATVVMAAAAAIAGCAGAPALTPFHADALLTSLPASCDAGAPSAAIVPAGLAVVRSEGAEVILVAARACVMMIDPRTGAAEPLPTRGDSIAPTMIHGTSGGLVFSSSLSGSVRAIDTEGAVTFNVSGLQHPLGVSLLPGGIALVAEHGTGRILRLGPSDESRARVIADGLQGPVDLVVADATRGYVTEASAGRVSTFRLDRYETRTVASGLDRPEGVALLADGRLAVVEAGAGRLVALDPADGALEVLVDGLPVHRAAANAVDQGFTVSDVAAAPNGTLYVSSDVERTVLRVTPRPRKPR
jgi:glucose/arabinose dehydrogenase